MSELSGGERHGKNFVLLESLRVWLESHPGETAAVYVAGEIEVRRCRDQLGALAARVQFVKFDDLARGGTVAPTVWRPWCHGR